MKHRILGKTGLSVSEIGLGTWQVGGKWGSPFNDQSADQILHTAIDNGVNFIDTADVYSDGLSEKAVGRVVRSRSEKVFVATKCGRQINPHVNTGYQPKVLQQYVEDSLKRLGLETIDLIQLHCPPAEVYRRDEIFEEFERLKEAGKIQHYGVSVERIIEAIQAMEYPGVSTVQVIFNLFRQKPTRQLFERTKKNNVGILARVPLASGLLSGKFSASTTFHKDDHRNFNRNGEVFDKGETFAGVDYDLALAAVEKLKDILGTEVPLAQRALQWILSHESVSCVIPGASSVDQITSNLQTQKAPALTATQIKACNLVYHEMIEPSVEQLW